MNAKKRLIIFDSNSIIHRAFHALPPLTSKKGEIVGAVYGFLLVFLKAVNEFRPDFIIACFDVKGPTFRHKKYEQYKAKRPSAPESLYLQIPKVKEVLESFGVPICEKQGFEADDLIGTIAKIAPQKQAFPELETIIISGDSDNLQLVDAKTKVYALRKGVKDTVLYDREKVFEKYGFSPRQLIDYKGLRGDPTDNIPGVPGIGDKTATELIQKYGSLEDIYENIDELKPRIKELLLKGKEDAFASKELGTIDLSAPIEFKMEDCRWDNYNKKKAAETLEELGFNSLIQRLP